VLDDLDRKILDLLQGSGKATSADIAGRTGLSVSAAAERVKRLEARGVITGWQARIDAEAIGLDVLAYLFVLIDRTEHNRPFLAALQDMPEVQECHHVTGEWSYLLKVRTTSTKALETLVSDRLKALPGVSRSLTSIALSSPKETAALPIPGEPGSGGGDA